MPAPKALTMAILAAFAVLPRLAAQRPDTASKTELVVGRDDFQQLRWLAGRWRGEGEAQPTFYVQYHFLDDSTITSESFSDSKFRTLRESTRIELRNHRVISRSGDSQWVVTSLDSTSVAFRHLTGTADDLLWQSHDDNEWLAVRAGPSAIDHPARSTTYHMKRVRGN